jgi:rubrerythrin
VPIETTTCIAQTVKRHSPGLDSCGHSVSFDAASEARSALRLASEGGLVKQSCGETSSSGACALELRASRRDLLRRGAVAGGFALSGAALLGWRPEAATPAPSRALDEKIFNFALLLEYLQAGFYTEGLQHGALRGEVRDFAEIVAEHEREHVDYLRRALGGKARTRPVFQFGEATRSQRKFVDAAVLLENIGVAAYNGQAAKLTKPSVAAAAQIVSVEGRHAAWISDIAGRPPAPRAADPGETAAQVTAALRATGFIKG